MKLCITTLGLAFAISFPSVALSQHKKTSDLPERNSIEWFNQAANSKSELVLFKLLQFTAPYPGYYQETSLNMIGGAFSARIVPDWATQAVHSANLESVALKQIRELLSQLSLTNTPTQPEPQAGVMHSALLFYDGSAYQQFRFNGEVPAQVQAVMEIIRHELRDADEVRAEELAARLKLMEQMYGDWKNRNGMKVPTSSRMRGFQNTRALLLGLLGQRKATPDAKPEAVSIYHAIILYPAGTVTGGAGGRNWSDDPVSRNGVTWTLTSSASSSSQREFEIEHNAINETVRIGDHAYYLSQGNLFIIRISEDWHSTVIQLNETLTTDTSEQGVLERFKSITKGDVSLQELQLYKQ